LAYKALIDQLGLTQGELGQRLGEDRSSIANFLRLLELAEPVREKLRDGRLSFGHAKILAGVPDILEQIRLAETVVNQDLSVRNLERLLQTDGRATTKTRAGHGSSAYLTNLEKKLSGHLGLRVQVRSSAKKGKGKLILHYADLDQFDQLMGKLG